MSIAKLEKAANGYWYIHWTDGRRSKRASTRTRDLAAAKAFYAQWLQLDALPAAKAKLTCAEVWAEYWSGHVALKNDLPQSQSTAHYAWKNLAVEFADFTVAEIDQRRVNKYVRRRASGEIGRPSKGSTVHHELTLLRAAINWCANRKLISKDDVPYITLPPLSEPKDIWLTADEIEMLFDAAEKRRVARGEDQLSRLERFLHIAANTGARKGAIMDLTWDRVDFETGVLHFAVPGRRKTSKRRGSVPISTALLPVLQRAYAERQNNLVMTSKTDMFESLVSLARGLGLHGVGPHTLRHSAATHMARRGVPLWIIAKILGNTVAQVEKTYAKHSPEDLRAALDGENFRAKIGA